MMTSTNGTVNKKTVQSSKSKSNLKVCSKDSLHTSQKEHEMNRKVFFSIVLVLAVLAVFAAGSFTSSAALIGTKSLVSRAPQIAPPGMMPDPIGHCGHCSMHIGPTTVARVIPYPVGHCGNCSKHIGPTTVAFVVPYPGGCSNCSKHIGPITSTGNILPSSLLSGAGSL
jgi:hypothetical protein